MLAQPKTYPGIFRNNFDIASTLYLTAKKLFMEIARPPIRNYTIITLHHQKATKEVCHIYLYVCAI